MTDNRVVKSQDEIRHWFHSKYNRHTLNMLSSDDRQRLFRDYVAQLLSDGIISASLAGRAKL